MKINPALLRRQCLESTVLDLGFTGFRFRFRVWGFGYS